MTVSCPDCRSVFRVDPAKVPATGVRARCSVCGGIIVVAGGTGSLRTPSRTPVRTPARTPVSAGPMVSPANDAAAFRQPSGMPGAMAPRGTPAGVPPVGAAPAGFAPAGAPATPARSSSATPLRPMTPMAPMTPVAPAPSYRATPAPAGRSATPAAPPSAPMAAPASATPSSATPRRSINPFLNADPGQKARRLARALVSDLVAYHPAKRDEGLAQGTLRQLFRDDIKKSYEEYVEQVGRELAESTPHFQDALNDVLAGGQRLF